MRTKGAQRPKGRVRHDVLAPRAVFLVGFMGAGKTSVARALGEHLGWPFEDLDDRIQKREGQSIEQIFRESGEAAFRRAEHSALRELLSEPANSPRVVALGGGAFAQEENAALLRSHGLPVVFLDAPVEELFRRCTEQRLEQKHDRPLACDQGAFAELYEARRTFYLAAGRRVETGGKSIEAVAVEVAQQLGLGLRKKRP